MGNQDQHQNDDPYGIDEDHEERRPIRGSQVIAFYAKRWIEIHIRWIQIQIDPWISHYPYHGKEIRGNKGQEEPHLKGLKFGEKSCKHVYGRTLEGQSPNVHKNKADINSNYVDAEDVKFRNNDKTVLCSKASDVGTFSDDESSQDVGHLPSVYREQWHTSCADSSSEDVIGNVGTQTRLNGDHSIVDSCELDEIDGGSPNDGNVGIKTGAKLVNGSVVEVDEIHRVSPNDENVGFQIRTIVVNNDHSIVDSDEVDKKDECSPNDENVGIQTKANYSDSSIVYENCETTGVDANDLVHKKVLEDDSETVIEPASSDETSNFGIEKRADLKGTGNAIIHPNEFYKYCKSGDESCIEIEIPFISMFGRSIPLDSKILDPEVVETESQQKSSPVELMKGKKLQKAFKRRQFQDSRDYSLDTVRSSTISDERAGLRSDPFRELPVKAISMSDRKKVHAYCNKTDLDKFDWRVSPQLPVPKIELTVAFKELAQSQVADGNAVTYGHSAAALNHQFEPLLTIIEQIADPNPPGPSITMRYELLRICTLRNYPKDNKPYLIQLAAAGFYYAAEGDEVICYCCGLRKSSWVATDVPERIHQRNNPNCKFLNRKSEYNVPIIYQGTTPNMERVEKLLRLLEEEPLTQSPTEAENGDDLSEYALPNTGANGETVKGLPYAKHPQFASKAQRISSFEGWPDSLSQTPEIMAEAGFYYAGFGDCARCYYCGIGLRHWTAEDNPWIEHARWSKRCAFLIQVKGQEFTQLVQMAVQYSNNDENQETGASESVGAKASAKTPNEVELVENILKTDAAQSVLEMGYQPKTIKKAIEFILKKDGRSGISSKTIMEKVLEFEENDSKKALMCNLANLDLNRQDRSAEGSSAEVTHSSSTKNTTRKSAEMKSSKGPQENKTISGKSGKESNKPTSKEIKEENEKLKEQTLCKICLDKTVCIVFLPCGHLCTCDDCAPAMRICPMCRKEVKGSVKTYMS